MSQPQPDTKRSDADLAKERSLQVINDALRMRTQRVAIAIILLVVGVALIPAGQYLLAFSALGVALLFVVLFFDAVGHLREVRDRPWTSLAPKISDTLAPKQATSATDVPEERTT